jgi:hypothetical protein
VTGAEFVRWRGKKIDERDNREDNLNLVALNLVESVLHEVTAIRLTVGVLRVPALLVAASEEAENGHLLKPAMVGDWQPQSQHHPNRDCIEPLHFRHDTNRQETFKLNVRTADLQRVIEREHRSSFREVNKENEATRSGTFID